TLKGAIQTGFAQLARIDADRAQVDAGRIGFEAAADTYNKTLESLFKIDESLASLDDKKFAKDVRTSLQLNRAAEVVSIEDAFVSGVIASGRFTNAEYLHFIQTVGAQHDAQENAIEDIH